MYMFPTAFNSLNCCYINEIPGGVFHRLHAVQVAGTVINCKIESALEGCGDR